MAGPEPLARRVDRQEEDLRAISDTVLDIKDTVDQHTDTLAQHTADLTAIKGTLADHGGRLNRIEDNQRRQGEQLSEILTLLRG